MKPRDWIVINMNRGSRLECLRCGAFYQPDYPIETWVMSSISKGFEKEHKGCRERADGLVCTHCGKRGHAPEGCKALNVKTPEQWLAGTDTGISSQTIYAVLYRRVDCLRPDIPYDPDDFGRCHRLLKLFPEWRPRLGEVAEKHPEWAPLVREWDALTALYEEERPTGRAPKLYARMQELRKEGATR